MTKDTTKPGYDQGKFLTGHSRLQDRDGRKCCKYCNGQGKRQYSETSETCIRCEGTGWVDMSVPELQAEITRLKQTITDITATAKAEKAMNDDVTIQGDREQGIGW